MKFLNLDRKWREINIHDYKIDWHAPSPSKYQKSVKDFLFQFWGNHICCEEFAFRALPSSPPLRLDFYNITKRVVVEADGDAHFRKNDHFHKEKNSFHDSVNRDLIKEEFLRINKIKLVRIYTTDFPLSKEKLEKIHGRFL
jgi:hypothetical protein